LGWNEGVFQATGRGASVNVQRMEPSQGILVDRVQQAVDAVRNALQGPSGGHAIQLAQVARELPSDRYLPKDACLPLRVLFESG